MSEKIDPIYQIVSQYVRTVPISQTEYESRTVQYTDKGGRIEVGIVVDTYNRYGEINSVRIGQDNIIDTVI